MKRGEYLSVCSLALRVDENIKCCFKQLDWYIAPFLKALMRDSWVTHDLLISITVHEKFLNWIYVQKYNLYRGLVYLTIWEAWSDTVQAVLFSLENSNFSKHINILHSKGQAACSLSLSLVVHDPQEGFIHKLYIFKSSDLIHAILAIKSFHEWDLIFILFLWKIHGNCASRNVASIGYGNENFRYFKDIGEEHSWVRLK